MTTAGAPLYDEPGQAGQAGQAGHIPAQPSPQAPPSEAPEDALRRFKDAQRATWALGDYPRVSRDLLGPVAARLVAACNITAGQHVLDVAAGSGNVALRAAAVGAHVVASDLTPALFTAGRAEAAARRVALDWVEADAEDLPFDDGMFDTVVSCVGVMFAPRHQQAADEIVRVCRSGGMVGLVSWTPQGMIGEFFGVFAPYLPPPPAGSQSPLLWGDGEHVRALFGDRVEWREHSLEALRVEHFTAPEEFCAYYKATFGPTMKAYANVADDPDRSAALDRDFLDFARRHACYDRPDHLYYDFEYLLSVGSVR
jgi:SAM-dependent methyltransferase